MVLKGLLFFYFLFFSPPSRLYEVENLNSHFRESKVPPELRRLRNWGKGQHAWRTSCRSQGSFVIPLGREQTYDVALPCFTGLIYIFSERIVYTEPRRHQPGLAECWLDVPKRLIAAPSYSRRIFSRVSSFKM